VAGRPIWVVLDLGGVTYISSTGWGLMAKYQEQLRAWGGAMALCAMGPDLHEIFGYLELHRIIKTYATFEEAMEAIARGETSTPVMGKAAPPVEEQPTPRDEGGVSFMEPDLDILEESEEAEVVMETTAGVQDDSFADLSPDDGGIDVASIAREGEISKDKQLRRIGWEEYGKRLRKARENGGGDTGDEVPDDGFRGEGTDEDGTADGGGDA
jgi:hypothetical protein